MSEKSHFEKLASINVSDKIEKKNNLSYLSWAWAVDQLLRADPTANWEYGPTMRFDNGSMMVVCTVTAFGKPMTMQLPVMDYKNKAIPNPDAFAVNTAMQRCLVKAIALHGLGLYIYAGEDLPEGEEKEPHPSSGAGTKKEAYDSLAPEDRAWIDGLAKEVTEICTVETPEKAISHIKESLGENSDITFKLALWWKLDSKTRSAIDAIQKGLKKDA